jgi:hypothetical protein
LQDLLLELKVVLDPVPGALALRVLGYEVLMLLLKTFDRLRSYG